MKIQTWPYTVKKAKSTPFHYPSDRIGEVSYSPSIWTANDSGIPLENGVMNLKYKRVRNPSSKVWLIETANYAYYFNPSLSSSVWCSFRHNNGANILFFDWHVEWRNANTIEKMGTYYFRPAN